MRGKGKEHHERFVTPSFASTTTILCMLRY